MASVDDPWVADLARLNPGGLWWNNPSLGIVISRRRAQWTGESSWLGDFQNVPPGQESRAWKVSGVRASRQQLQMQPALSTPGDGGFGRSRPCWSLVDCQTRACWWQPPSTAFRPLLCPFWPKYFLSGYASGLTRPWCCSSSGKGFKLNLNHLKDCPLCEICVVCKSENLKYYSPGYDCMMFTYDKIRKNSY